MSVPAAGWVMIIAVVLLVAAIVVYLVATIVALRKITAGLDDAFTVAAPHSNVPAMR